MSDNVHAGSGITFLQKIIAILGGVIAPIVVVYLLVATNAVETPAVAIDVAKNIKPVAKVEVAPDRTNYVDMTGEEVVNKACNACHGAGLPGIPKIGDNDAWKARIAQGYEALTNNAIQGLRMMPARGGNPDLTDLEMQRAVAFMANQSGANFTAPAEK